MATQRKRQHQGGQGELGASALFGAALPGLAVRKLPEFPWLRTLRDRSAGVSSGFLTRQGLGGVHPAPPAKSAIQLALPQVWLQKTALNLKDKRLEPFQNSCSDHGGKWPSD